MVNWVLTIVSGVFSCFIAILATVGVEKLGGKLGGVLATTPTTIIPFCIGLVLADNSQADIDSSLFAVPPTIALTALYLLAWREFPCIPFIAAMEKRKPLQALLMVLLLSMTMWFCGAALLYFALPAAAANGVPVQATGFIGLAMNFTVGLCGLVFRNRPAPGGKLPVTWLTYASRGLLAGTAISISIILSTISPTLGGIMSAFPANTSTAMISLWWSQGLAVSQGSATSMACGNLAVSSYAIMFAMIWPHIYRNDVPLVFALIVVSVLCWTLAAFFVSIPMFSLVQTFKTDAKFAHLDESDLKPLSETLVEMSEDSSKESEVPGSPESTSKNVV